MKKSIAVIMTVHNRRDTTVECIRRFYACKGIKDYEVEFYVMDDGSTDGTAEAVIEAFPQVIILHGDGELFWNRGMYECWKEAIKKHHDYYLWLNDDTIVYEWALEELIDCIQEVGDEKGIIVGCCCDSETQTKITYGGKIDRQWVEPGDYPRGLEEINGNIVLIPNYVCQKIGINDPYYHHSAGDNEYGYRARKNGILPYLTRKYVGICDRHDTLKMSYDARYSLKERWTALNTPFGPRPKELFHLYMQYYGFWTAVKVVLPVYKNCLFPRKNK